MDKSPFEQIIKQQRQIQKALESPIEQIIKQQRQFQKALESPIEQIIKQQRHFEKALQIQMLNVASPIDIFNKHINESFSIFLKPNIIQRIDFDIPLNEDLLEEAYNYESSSKKILNSPNDLQTKLEQYIKENKKLTLGAIFLFVYEEYTREVALQFMKMLFTFLISISSGQSATDLVTKLQEQIVETTTYRDAVEMYKESKPDFLIYKIGITRDETILRQGTTRNSPVIDNVKYPRNTVVQIMKRKNNWIKVQIEVDNTCINGWIQESIVRKLKEE